MIEKEEQARKSLVLIADCEQRLEGGADEASTVTPFNASNQERVAALIKIIIISYDHLQINNTIIERLVKHEKL